MSQSLFTRTEIPSEADKAKILDVLRHADPSILYRDITRHRPSHRVAAWRGLVVWVMNRHHGIPQADLAGWFGITKTAASRLVCRNDAILASTSPETAHTRAVVAEILKEAA